MRNRAKANTKHNKLDKKQKEEIAKRLGKQLAQIYLNSQKGIPT